jgi:integrase
LLSLRSLCHRKRTRLFQVWPQQFEALPLSRALLMEWKAAMDELAPSTVNVRLAAMRKLVEEAQRNGREEAASLADVPNVRQQGTRMGNWLTREQAKELLTVPDRSTLKGKRDYVVLALLVGCALRRRELASLNIDEIQMREGRWVIADLRGKGGRVRTVAVPHWVKCGINAWLTAAAIEEGRLLRRIRKGGGVGEELSDWAVWSVVEQSAKEIGIESFGAHDLRRTCAKLCRKAGGDLEQIKFLLRRNQCSRMLAASGCRRCSISSRSACTLLGQWGYPPNTFGGPSFWSFRMAKWLAGEAPRLLWQAAYQQSAFCE